MLNYAKTRLATFWRTKSSLMMTLRRRLREAIREQEGLETVHVKALKEALNTGDVDDVDMKWKKSVDEWHAIMERIAEGEKLAFMGEERPLKPLHDIHDLLERLIHRLDEVHKRAEGKAKVIISKLIEGLLKDKKWIDELVAEEGQVLKAEYNALLRQQEGKEGTVQTFVLAYDEVMQLMDKAWEERTDTRKAEREEENAEEAIKHALKLIDSYGQQGDKALTELQRECDKLDKDVKQIHQHLDAMLKGFLFILKVCVDLWFQYGGKDEKGFEQIKETLRQTGFPENDLKDLDTVFAKAKAENHDAATVALEAFRRMARKRNNA